MTPRDLDIFLDKQIANYINDNYIESVIEIIESNYFIENHYKNNEKCIYERNLRRNFLKHFNKELFSADIHLYIRKDGQLMSMTPRLQKKIYNKYKK